MNPKIKNIIIFLVLVVVLVLGYVFFLKKSPETASLDSSGTPVSSTDNVVSDDFLALLSDVKDITLNDAILSDPTFTTLHDSSILLVPDGTEGRPNPFAPLGTDAVASPVTAGAQADLSVPAGATTPNPKDKISPKKP